MLNSAFSIGNESRPLLDYYGYLQVIKGVILTMVDINKGTFFSTHGLEPAKNPSSNKSKYINAKIKFHGVFSAIMLCDLTNEKFPRYKEIDEIYKSKYIPSIEDVVNLSINRDPKSIFVGTWMLSSLARYEPFKWHKILQGQSDDIIKYIFEFWDRHFPYTIYLLLDKYRKNVSIERMYLANGNKTFNSIIYYSLYSNGDDILLSKCLNINPLIASRFFSVKSILRCEKRTLAWILRIPWNPNCSTNFNFGITRN